MQNCGTKVILESHIWLGSSKDPPKFSFVIYTLPLKKEEEGFRTACVSTLFRTFRLLKQRKITV
jgi:hypothetical protein